MPKKLTKKQLEELVDTLGKLRAKASDMEAEDKEIAKTLIEHLGEGGEAEGRLFRVAVVAQDRSNLDMATVREVLSENFITQHSKHNHVVYVKVSARKKD